jgi:four helix bundle protein
LGIGRYNWSFSRKWERMDKKDSTIKSYKDLRVWQGGVDLVTEIYRETQSFPPQEMYGLTNQLRRAAVSVPSNIAEGHAREHTREFLNFISIAQGSLAEMQTQIEIAKRLKYLSEEKTDRLLDQTVSLSKQLYSLRNALTKNG